METQLAGSGSLAGGEPELEDILIHEIGPVRPVCPVSESVKNWLRDVVKDESSENQPEVTKQGGSWPKIDKVPALLRKVKANKGCFDPLVVSIGPYHHGKPGLELMQQRKKTMACQYVNGALKSLEDLYQKVSRLAKDAKECYTYKKAVNRLTNEEFIQMMVLDACFILQHIDCVVNGKLEALKIEVSMLRSVHRDIFLLENQIPFKVLKEILDDKSGDEKKKMDMLFFFATECQGFPPPVEKQEFLDFALWRKKCVQDRNDKTELSDGEPAHLLDIMHNNLVDKSSWTYNPRRKRKGNFWFSYRSAMELKGVGINFRLSKTNKYGDVHFHQSKRYFKSYLYLPQVWIGRFTKSALLNMVAHESRTSGLDSFGVSSYIYFMDSLIDNAEDVKELRKNGILVNFMGSDQQVADLFNEISERLLPNPHAYADVKDGIEEHYKNRMKIWMAEWVHNHFSSPWTVLAFIGAILALSLSVVQTYESTKQSRC